MLINTKNYNHADCVRPLYSTFIENIFPEKIYLEFGYDCSVYFSTSEYKLYTKSHNLGNLNI